MKRLLIANRGEIAIRVARAASALGITSIAVYATDDATSLHVLKTDEAIALEGTGAKAYLDIEGLLDAASEAGADAVHPGYGFLSESAEFATAVRAAGLVFVGPDVETISLFGDKARARALAIDNDVPVLNGSNTAVTVEEAHAFMTSQADGRAIVVKAVAGGGGRGMRVVRDAADLDNAFARATSEAQAAFGKGDLYVEEYMPAARHIEVQIIGDCKGAVSHLWERDCSLQRRHQKVIEIAPSPSLDDTMRQQLLDAAVTLASAARYQGLGTMEFLIDSAATRFCFIEGNARLQVEHTVTEEILGLDLVRAQLRLATGASLKDLALTQEEVPAPRGYAIQARVNMESMSSDGSVTPSGGTLTAFDVPTGPGVRVDTFGYTGYATSPHYDSLLAKVIVHSPSPDFTDAARLAYLALCEFKLDGVASNLDFLKNIITHNAFETNTAATDFIDDHTAVLVPTGTHRALYSMAPADATEPVSATRETALALGESGVLSRMPGTIVSLPVTPGDEVAEGQVLLVMEAMKMEHEIRAPESGEILDIHVTEGETVTEGQCLLTYAARDVTHKLAVEEQIQDLDYIRPDLQEVYARKAAGLDENRPEAVSKRHGTGRRTARENMEDLCDTGTFVEYGAIVLAAQRRRRTIEDLIDRTTGDGMVCGTGHVNGDLFPVERSRAMLMSYDYMVLAGTQGWMNHAKKDRMFELALENRLPTILFAEGGGGRPGDTDANVVAGLDCLAFSYFARLSALVPVIGITTGFCFAGNAVLLACCDVIIATEGSNIGIGGPAMIEGGGLGVFRPEEVGPVEIQVANGVVDIAVKDEAEAVQVAKKYLSYFQGSLDTWDAPDPRELRFIVPENRLRYYDMREVIRGLANIGSILEIRKQWGIGIITAFIRVEGRPVAVIANNPGHLAGALDTAGADKAARFMQLCDAFDIPILSLIDCPGIMVGPESEETALVRHAGRMFVQGANLDVPLIAIVIRKGYGLGAQAMAGGSFKGPVIMLSWPTGEFGGMGLEGAVKLGYRRELQAIEDPSARAAAYDKMVAAAYAHGKAVNMASYFEIDDVIDPAETRQKIIATLKALPVKVPRDKKKRPNIDTW